MPEPEIRKGKLVFQKDERRVQFPNKKGVMGNPTPIPLGQLAKDLENAMDAEIDVDLELEQGQVRRIRRPGQPWEGPAVPAPAPGAAQGAPAYVPDFHNPYNFIPALPRTYQGELRDGPPAGHDCFQGDRYSGLIRVKMTVVTPLLVMDAAAATKDNRNHKSFPVRINAAGAPHIAPTAVKGVIRSGFEAVTNSRLSVFLGHEARLAYRMPAGEGLSLVPARVENGQITLFYGATPPPPAQQRPMYAAWLPRYQGPAVNYVRGGLPAHGEKVHCWLEQFDRRGQFQYWRVRKIARTQAELGSAPAPTAGGGGAHRAVGTAMIAVEGWVCITNRNIDRKHDERVFFVHGTAAPRVPLTLEIETKWKELIGNYQAIHEGDLKKRRELNQQPDAYLRREPGQTAWSRHVYRPEDRTLRDGTLCYVKLNAQNQVTEIYPVIIARKLYEASPRELLPESLRPATSLSELSPADRVFGWVNQEGEGACQGSVRIGAVTCGGGAETIQDFAAPGVPLAILGQPKEQQARFYAARNQRGEAFADGAATAGFKNGLGLRGRKVYPHHRALPAGYWEKPEQDRTQTLVAGKYHQEYRRPVFNGVEGDDQNRSVQGWVKPGTVFHVPMHVTNISVAELGALLWLLSLDEGCHFRMGGGKPLGFGSVRLEIEEMKLDDGERLKARYSTLLAGEAAAGAGNCVAAIAEAAPLIERFKSAVAAIGGAGVVFDRVPFIAAFLRAARGFGDDLPIHYPRARDGHGAGPLAPHPEGKAFEWFVENSRGGNPGGPRLALPDLATDRGLPILKSKQKDR